MAGRRRVDLNCGSRVGIGTFEMSEDRCLRLRINRIFTPSRPQHPN